MSKRVTANMLHVLKCIPSGDIFRGKADGQAGRVGRVNTIDALKRHGLIERTQLGRGNWRLTDAGRKALINASRRSLGEDS